MDVPTLARRLWAGWKRFGRRLGDLQARFLLTLFYFVVLAPFGLAVRAVADPLALRPRTPKGWQVRPTAPPPDLERARQQF